jgi:hypothetical protein
MITLEFTITFGKGASILRDMLTASALAIALIFVPFASIVTYPCNLFVTLVHESSHALAALATGGAVVGLAS